MLLDRRMSALRENRNGIWSFRTSVLFICLRSSNVDKFKVVGCHGNFNKYNGKLRFKVAAFTRKLRRNGAKLFIYD